MQMSKPIELNGNPAGDGKVPLICTPLVGRSRDSILSEVRLVTAKKPDLLEWRVDFFDGIGSTDEVLAMAAGIRQAAAGIPLLFTRRSIKEGGETICLSEEAVVELYAAVCESRSADLIDFEMSNDPRYVRRVREVSKANETKMIMSFHDFHGTPGLEFLKQKFLQAEQLGADIAKVAVMPRSREDVLTLLTATLQSSQQRNIPLVSMSMGGYGSLTRLFGWVFGSAMTFAIGESSSAPGQVPIEDLNTVLGILRTSLAGG